MRGLFFPVLGLVVLIVVGTVLLVMYPPSWLVWISAPSAGSDSAASSAATKEPPVPVRAVEHPKRTAGGDVPLLPEPPPPAPPARPPVTAPKAPFPAAEEIAVGSSKAAVMASFGPPEASVIGADRGAMNEWLVYLQRDTGKQTSVFLLNGKVVSALTYLQ